MSGVMTARAAIERLGTVDSIEKTKILKEVLLEKWSGRLGRKYNPDADWLGEGSEKRGFPKLANDEAKAVVAILLENQFAYQLSKEMRVVGNRVIYQDTTTADEALPTKYALPIIRRVYALMTKNDWSTTQPLPGPSGFVFWLDFLREAWSSDNNLYNLLYSYRTAFEAQELSVPTKGKLSLQRALLQVKKQILGVTWTLESLEDARAQLGIDVENELLNAFGEEFARNLFGRHLNDIYTAATTATPVGTAMPTLWGANSQHTIPAKGATSITDYKSVVYNALLDADTDFQRRNRIPSDGIICGYGLAGFLRKMITATSADNVQDDSMSSVGFTNYGEYGARWTIWGTDFLPDNDGFLYRKNPDTLHAAHIYAPYIPVQVMPAVYGDYDASTGNYQNKDAWTRNIRERSASLVTKPYAFQPITVADLTVW